MRELQLPRVIFGTSGLGNLFVVLTDEEKLEIVKQCFICSDGPVVFDSAGKYGAGLALETLGKCLHALDVPPEQVVISNKLGWLRVPLTGDEPTFEPGVWKDLRHDAVQKISFEGILECFEQGNQLLGGYLPQMVSVHDPDEYIASADSLAEADLRYNDILQAYKALFRLKEEGKVRAVGVGAKDWRIIERISRDVSLDWIMLANSMTIWRHPPELIKFIREMAAKGVYIINSAVFHSGFLVGGDHFDYRKVSPGTPDNDQLLARRDTFFSVCGQFGVKPSDACVRFALDVPGVDSIALNTTRAVRVKENLDMVNAAIPPAFWKALEEKMSVRRY